MRPLKEQRTIRTFAVFDADNTIWKYDLIEALVVWMEHTSQRNACTTSLQN